MIKKEVKYPELHLVLGYPSQYFWDCIYIFKCVSFWPYVDLKKALLLKSFFFLLQFKFCVFHQLKRTFEMHSWCYWVFADLLQELNMALCTLNAPLDSLYLSSGHAVSWGGGEEPACHCWSDPGRARFPWSQQAQPQGAAHTATGFYTQFKLRFHSEMPHYTCIQWGKKLFGSRRILQVITLKKMREFKEKYSGIHNVWFLFGQ